MKTIALFVILFSLTSVAVAEPEKEAPKPAPVIEQPSKTEMLQIYTDACLEKIMPQAMDCPASLWRECADAKNFCRREARKFI